jgi:hypothetical protein
MHVSTRISFPDETGENAAVGSASVTQRSWARLT